MEQWWQQNNEVIPESYMQNEVEHLKSEVEDLTGSIPLLLNRCLVNGKIDLSAEVLQNVFNQVQDFMTNIKDGPGITESAWQR